VADHQLQAAEGPQVLVHVAALAEVVAAQVVGGAQVARVAAGLSLQHRVGPPVHGHGGPAAAGRAGSPGPPRQAAAARPRQPAPDVAAGGPAGPARVARGGLQHGAHAHGFLSAHVALDGKPRDERRRPASRVAPRQARDHGGRSAADPFGPGRAPGGPRPGPPPPHVGLHLREAGGIALEVGPVDQVLLQQHVQHRCHQGRVGAWAHRHPLVGQARGGAGTPGVHGHDRHAPPAAAPDPRLQGSPEAQIGHVGPPQQDQPGVFQGGRVQPRIGSAEYEGGHEALRGRAEAARGGGEPAEQGKEARAQGFRVVQGPAAGAGAAQEDHRLRSVPLADLRQPPGHPVQGLLPAGLAEAPRTARPIGQKRAAEAVRSVDPPGHGVAAGAAPGQGRAQRVVADAREASLPHLGQQGAAGPAVQVAGNRQLLRPRRAHQGSPCRSHSATPAPMARPSR
jgi:translation initiation factor IF-2